MSKVTKMKPKNDFKGVQMSYHELGNSLLHRTIQKVTNTEVSDLGTARRISQVFKALVKVLDEMKKAYIAGPQKQFHDELKAASIDYEEGKDAPDFGKGPADKMQAALDEEGIPYERDGNDFSFGNGVEQPDPKLQERFNTLGEQRDGEEKAIAEKFEEIRKAHDARLKDFDEEKVWVKVVPLAPQHFKEIKISAAELDSLGALFDDTGKVREEALRAKFAH